MKVSIKGFPVTMEIKNTGIEIDVTDNNDDHLGDLYVTKTQLIRCHGKTQKENGKSIKWQDFIDYMRKETEDSLDISPALLQSRPAARKRRAWRRKMKVNQTKKTDKAELTTKQFATRAVAMYKRGRRFRRSQLRWDMSAARGRTGSPMR